MGCSSSVETSSQGGSQPTGNENKANANANQGNAGAEEDEAGYGEEGQAFDKDGNPKNQYDRKHDNDDDLFKVEEQGEGDQFMATKPWIGALKAPSNPPAFNPNAPSQKLKLEYVYGYRAIDSRNNLFYNSNGHAVYMSASLGIILNQEKNTQTFFGGGEFSDQKQHNDDVTALALSPDRKRVATGQVGKQPKVYIWDAETGEFLGTGKQSRNTRCTKAIGWNHDGTMIAALGYDNDHTVAVFDASGQKLGEVKSGSDPMVDLCWHPKENTFACAAKRGVTLFSMNGRSLSKDGNCQFSGQPMDPMTCITYGPDGTCYSGSYKGRVYAWMGKSCKTSQKVGKRMINGICATSDTIYVGGDCEIVVCSTGLKEQDKISLPADARAIDVRDGKMLIGLRNGDIIERVNGNNRTIMESHSDGEVWGLTYDTNTNRIITTCDDNKIYVWDPEQRKSVLRSIVNEKAGPYPRTGGASSLTAYPPNQQSRAVAINPKTGEVAIAVNSGEIHIRDSIDSLQTKKVLAEPKSWCEVIAFSPDGSIMATGDHSKTLYFFDASNGYSKIATKTGHTAAILSIDFSEDSQYAQVVDNAYEILFYNAKTGDQMTSGGTELRDCQWATHTAKISWPTIGIFPPATSGDFVNGVDKSPDGSIFATGDDQGCVNLFRNPVNEKGAESNRFKAHSEHVVRVKFSPKGDRLFSVGGYDRCVMQWQIV